MGLAMMPCLSDQCRAAASQIASQNEDVIQIDFSRLKVTAFDEEDTDAVPSAWKAPQLWEPVIWRELDEAEAGCDRDRERGCNLPGLAVAGWCCWQTGGTFAAFLVELFAPEDPPQASADELRASRWTLGQVKPVVPRMHPPLHAFALHAPPPLGRWLQPPSLGPTGFLLFGSVMKTEVQHGPTMSCTSCS
ncbi:unnamed protein product [Durusdinium trenchii]|uniref:Uncharacterized protein n=1 Tax=Durusdinium trenchii TaxID=1381693 RepID=A0ABP0RQS4_9DINO